MPMKLSYMGKTCQGVLRRLNNDWKEHVIKNEKLNVEHKRERKRCYWSRMNFFLIVVTGY